METLEGRRVLIVGGTSGIGLACATRMKAAGATIAVAGRNVERGQAAASKLGATVVAGDAGIPRDAARMVAEAESAMGGLDVLLSCAGGDPMPRLLRDIPIDELMADINGTLAPVVLPARAAYDVMSQRSGGTILMVASDAGKLATPGESAIGAAMAAIALFSRALATEGKRNGINANCITPSIVRGTGLYGRLMSDPFASRLFAKAESLAGLGVVEPEDLAALAVFLSSVGARRITGQTISVTGGISAI